MRAIFDMAAKTRSVSGSPTSGSAKRFRTGVPGISCFVPGEEILSGQKVFVFLPEN